MQTILSYGMGVESTAILVRWLEDASVRPCRLDELIVITSHTGDEYADTYRDVETYVLPLLRKHRVRYVQVARAGSSQTNGIVVLSDSRETSRLFWDGAYKLSDELRKAGTVPQFGGEHICSLKFKAWVIERWFAENLAQPVRHAFGYNASETKRVEKSEAANARRVAFGFNAEEHKRIDKALRYDSPLRQSFYPLVEWGWTRDDCIDYLHRALGVLWHKSACVQCPFNALKDDALRRHYQHPEQVADAMLLEHVSLALNPRGTLYRNQSLIEITLASGNRLATVSYEQKRDGTPWAIYRVRRIYHAAKAKDGSPLENKKGTAIRAVERLIEEVDKTEALAHLQMLISPTDEVVVLRDIRYVYRQRCATQYPTREEFLVAAPAVVESKARYGLEWFEDQWNRRQQELFPLAA
jgi:hypothetical protein